MPPGRLVWAALLALPLGTGLLFGAAPGALDSPVFERDVRPILKAHCFHCHGEGEELEGGIDLRLRRHLAEAAGAEGDPVMTPGEADQSLMVALMRSGEMPKGEKKVSAEEIAVVEAWIARGAPTARPEPESVPQGFFITEEERNFWSFQPIARPPLPKVADDEKARVRTPVDLFVAAALAERGLRLAPEADPVTLIQRVYADLLGLPPAPETIKAFLKDPAKDAYERLLDRVLDSPQYGERWGRHWLDAAGYADSNGQAEADSVRAHAWRYRDYVIRALNEDMPWDRFVQEQLAGDEMIGVIESNAAEKALDPAVRDRLAATGFLRMAPDGTGDEVMDADLARNQVIAETLNIVSTSLLGLTVGCAQCHDHRYDPISQKDYYRLRAVFEPAFDWKRWRSPDARLVSLYTERQRKEAAAIEEEAKKIDEEAADLRRELLDAVFERELAELPEDLREAARVARTTPRNERTEAQHALFKKYPAADVQGALDLYDPEANKRVLEKQAEASRLRATKPPEPKVMCLTERGGDPAETRVFFRGDHEAPREPVTPGVLEVLGRPEWRVFQSIPEQAEGLPSSGRRLAYARWLTSGEHPLVARVLVNRIWMHHFGRGLVSTPGDFGKLGETASHPELLDWLASEFMAGDWHLKRFHRLLMTSAVYRQSSSNPEALREDPDNRLYGRWKLKRLEAEAVRDAMLAVSGTLETSFFGEPVPIAQDGAGRVVPGVQQTNERGDPTLVSEIGGLAFRRSVYLQVRRSLPVTLLDAFDAPVMSPNCEARESSVMPTQSLTLLNGASVAELALRFADRLFKEAPEDTASRVRRAWWLAFGCEPSDMERQRATAYLDKQTSLLAAKVAQDQDPARLALASLCQALLGSSRFLYIE